MANGKEATVAQGATAPYLPYSAFKAFISRLDAKALPPRVDRSLMSGMSGGDQSALRTTLRFLGLVAAEGDVVSEKFRMLVASYNTDEWPTRISALLASSYAAILEGVPLETATGAQLEEAFRARGGVTGAAVVDKAVRFFLSMAEDGNLVVSPYFKKRASPGAARARSRPKTKISNGGEAQVDREEATPEEMKQLRYTVPSGEIRIWLPKRVSVKELKKFATYVEDYYEMSGGDEAKST